MNNKGIEKALITDKKELLPGIISMWIQSSHIADDAVPGQFVNIFCRDNSRLLPRPISICEADSKKGLVRIVFRIAGAGTEEFSEYNIGEYIDILGPLGNGYDINTSASSIIIGGGIGIPPMLWLAQKLNGEKNIVLGYRDAVFLEKEFEGLGNVYIATEDGSIGTKGFVTDCIRENNIKGSRIFACGPIPMLKSIKKLSEDMHIDAFISMEERMACGIGACLGCVCKSSDRDEHTNVNNKRVCKEGPVFRADSVTL